VDGMPVSNLNFGDMNFFVFQEHIRNPEGELEELTQIYVSRGLSYYLAKQVINQTYRKSLLFFNSLEF
jgi:hypothetical protein